MMDGGGDWYYGAHNDNHARHGVHPHQSWEHHFPGLMFVTGVEDLPDKLDVGADPYEGADMIDGNTTAVPTIARYATT